jgi:adenosylhomocysteine nucleosidase
MNATPLSSVAAPHDVGVVFALTAEQGCFEDLLLEAMRFETESGVVRTGMLDGRTVATIVSGPGRDAAAKACEALIAAHRPKLVITAGFCGGLQLQLPRNAITVADRILATNGMPHELAAAVRAGFQLAPAFVGPWVTVERIVAKSADKKTLGERSGALACEMESLAVAEVCAARGVPCLAVRVVSDPVDEDLPTDLDALMQPRSTAGMVGAVLGTLWRRPSSIKDLLRLKEQALVAADALANYLAGLVRQLPRVERLPGAESQGSDQ